MKTKTQRLVEEAKATGIYREIEVVGLNKAKAERGDKVVTLKLNKKGEVEEK